MSVRQATIHMGAQIFLAQWLEEVIVAEEVICELWFKAGQRLDSLRVCHGSEFSGHQNIFTSHVRHSSGTYKDIKQEEK